MKGRVQKISRDTCPQKNRAEPEGYVEGQTFMRIPENNITNAVPEQYGLLGQILSPANLSQAYKRVRSNKGSSGVDKIEVESLKDYLIDHKEALITSISTGKFKPNPVRRVEIPKGEGKEKRKLGIPTVVDRVVQEAIAQVLSPIYEKQFSTNSYGFRPKRNAHQALEKCQGHITNGYKYAVDMDLEKFFDTVDHSKLIEVLSRTVKDGRVVSLIHKYLNAGAIVRQKYEATKEGVPQGGPLSPLLGNIMLNELDKELEERGHRFVRYADDLVILCKSRRAAQRTLASIVAYIENKLFLKVNRGKTVVGYVSKIKFLGYSFYVKKGEGRLRVHPKSLFKMKERIRTLTSRSNGWGNVRRKKLLKQYIIGWVNYFKLADIKSFLPRLDEWYRRRLRAVIWKQWKRIRTRGRNLMKLGIKKYRAWEYANTRKNCWRTANSPILKRSVTNVRLEQAGYIFFTKYYRKAVNGVN
jgi:group II intron reverse transcriptase/maturase